MAEGLSLVSNKSISHLTKDSCEIGVFKGLERLVNGQFRKVHSIIPCNTWNCPVCRPKKVKKFAKRALTGGIGVYEGGNGFRSRYEAKLFTFTCPGRDYRMRIEENPYTHDYIGSVDPETAYRDMCDQFDKLVRAMKKTLGHFMYLRVVEPHRDGYPHFHVLFVGKCIIPKSVLTYVKDHWESRYGQGRAWVTGTKNKAGKPIAFKSVKHALNYCLKYLKKAPGKFHRFSRPVTNCKNALSPPSVSVKVWVGYAFTRSTDDFQGYECIEFGFNSELDLEKYLYKEKLLYHEGAYHNASIQTPVSSYFERSKNLKECLDFFDSIIEENKKKHNIQLKLF